MASFTSLVSDIFSKSLRAEFLFILIIILSIVYLVRKHVQSRNFPPTPWNLPLVGSLPWIMWSLYWSGLPLYGFLRQLQHKYGTVYAFNLLGQLVVVVNNYAPIQKAFNNPHMKDRPRAMVSGVGKGVILSSGDSWYQQRRFTQTTFRSLGVGKNTFDKNIAIESEALITEIARLNCKAFDPRPFLCNSVSNVICSIVFGKRFDYDDEEFRCFQELASRQTDLNAKILHNIFLPFFNYFPSKNVKLAVGNSRQLHNFIDSIVREHKLDFNPGHLRDYVDVFLNELRLNKKESSRRMGELDEQNLRETVVQLFNAGTDTTALTMRWGLLYMVSYPEIQARVQREVDEVVGRERLPMISDKPSLPYTQATILEIQRIAAISRLGVPHLCSKTTSLYDYVIPEGAIVVANLWGVMRDPDLWSEPNVFKPERFLNEEGDFYQPKEIIPFSTGHRVCLGDNLARMELFIFFTHLLHQFTFEKSSSNDCLPDSDQDRTPKEVLLRAIKRK